MQITYNTASFLKMAVKRHGKISILWLTSSSRKGLSTTMTRTSKIVPQKEDAASLSQTSKSKPKVIPTVEQCTPTEFNTVNDFSVDRPLSTSGRCEHVSRYISVVTNIEKVKKDCQWKETVLVEIPRSDESITNHKAGFLCVYTYPFTLGPVDSSNHSSPTIDLVILDFFDKVPSDAWPNLSIFLEDSLHALLLLQQVLSDGVQMRPPPDGEVEAPKPDKGKKRRKKMAADSPVAKKPKSRRPRVAPRTSTSASGASPSTGDEDDDDDGYRLVQRTRSGTVDSGRSRTVETLEEGVNAVPEPPVERGAVLVEETVPPYSKGFGPRAFWGQDFPLGDIDALGGLNLGPQFLPGELRDA
uniref:Uncharacterized protein LOC104217083 n=1 Tax=Nicotiana sylvestris TaxID=4096 RepID=A0A1U7VKQ4_NICSY|nr:PREDICTED: uncharacterized protein LOC104217083 [Nicotiana sylvestris]